MPERKYLVLQVWQYFVKFERAHISKLDSSVPEEAVICGRDAIIHFMALQNEAISYQVGNMLHWLRAQSHWLTHTESVHLKKTCSFSAVSVQNFFEPMTSVDDFLMIPQQAKLCWIMHDPMLQTVPAESVETCWRENWAVVIFGLAYVFFRT